MFLTLKRTDPHLSRHVRFHSLTVRVTHWINALAVILMIMSGWQIYDASPLFPFNFPLSVTLGGWLAGGILWHFAVMWVLVLNLLIYVLYGLFSGHFRRDFFPVTGKGLWHSFRQAVTFRLSHEDITVYNAIQRVFYIGVVLALILQVLTGLAIWKPVQLHALARLFGDYDRARFWHFVGMSLLVAFLFIHVLLVILVPRTLIPMLTGRVRLGARAGARPPGEAIQSSSGDAHEG